MEHYIIDGNNLIGKIRELRKIFEIDKQKAREELVVLLNNFFTDKKVKVSLHLDGYENISLRILNGKIFYSKNKPADNLIRKEIDNSLSKRLIRLVTSDLSLAEYGKVNGCQVILSEEFYEIIRNKYVVDETDEKEKLPKDVDYWKTIFGIE